jgi:hypothetical protein
VPGTTLIVGDNDFVTPNPISERATPTISQTANDAFGRLMDSLAREIIAAPFETPSAPVKRTYGGRLWPASARRTRPGQ